MKKLKILVVDDIFANRLLLTEIIRILGHESTQAENGKVAVDLLERENFDLILMDIEMPVMNGLETTEYIRTTFASPKNLISIVALTAHNPSLFFEDFRNVGFDDLITKPYSMDKIMEVINNLT